MKRQITRTYLVFAASLAVAQSFFFATYQLFLAGKGISYLEMNLINAFFMLGNFIFQVPTGAFADCYGRKKSINLGCFLLAVSFLGYYFGNFFWLFVALEILGALGHSFIYGALNSWVIDELNSNDAQDNSKLMARGKSWHLIGLGLGSCLGGYLGQYNLALPWLLAASAHLLLIPLFLFFMKETNFHVKKINFNWKKFFGSIFKESGKGIRYSWDHKVIIQPLIFCAIASACFMGLNMQWQGFFKAKGLAVADMGLIFLGASMAVLLGTLLTRWWFERRAPNLKMLFLSQGITAIGIILTTAYVGIVPIMFWFMLHEVGRGMIDPIETSWLHSNIISEHRTTIPSFGSMLNSGGNVLGLIISGLLATNYSINTSWLVSGMVLLTTVIIFLRIMTKK